MTTAYVDPQGTHNPTPGASPPALWGDTVRDDLEFLIAPPGCKVVTNSNLNTSTLIVYAVPFAGTDTRDTDNFHDVSTNNTRMTVPTGLGGVYRLTVNCEWGVYGPGHRLVGYRISGGSNVWLQSSMASSAFDMRLSGSDEIALTAGQYVEVMAVQDSGGALFLNSCRVSLTWVAR